MGAAAYGGRGFKGRARVRLAVHCNFEAGGGGGSKPGRIKGGG